MLLTCVFCILNVLCALSDNFARIAAVTASSRLNQEISRLIFGWFSYEYDGTLPYTFIDDGGNDTYDSGNFVRNISFVQFCFKLKLK